MVTARWTWAIEAAPTGSGSISAKTSSIGRPRPSSIAALIFSNGRRGQAVLQHGKVVRGRLADQIGAGGERLAELDRGRADRLEGLGIAGHLRHPRAEAGEPGQPAHRRRRVRIALDAAQRAVPRQHPAPFQEPPDMGDGTGQIFQPEWIATRPPRIGSAFTLRKPAASIMRAKPGMSGKRSIDSIR